MFARVRVCACVRVILVLVWGTFYVPHSIYVRTWYQHVCTWYQPATMIRIAEIAYIPGWGMYYVRHTYVPGISTYVSGKGRLPRYVYVDTYVPGLHPPPKKEQNAQHTLRERRTHSTRATSKKKEQNAQHTLSERHTHSATQRV